MPELDLAAVEARARAATPGPWSYDGQHDEITAPRGEEYWVVASEWRNTPNAAPSDQFGHQYSADFDFIAHAREDVPGLLAAIREAQERIAALEAALRDVVHDRPSAHTDAVWLKARAALAAPAAGPAPEVR